jgi:hypothetical protein
MRYVVAIVHQYQLDVTIQLFAYMCTPKKGTPRPKEHNEILGFPSEALDMLDWVAAAVTIVKKLL